MKIELTSPHTSDGTTFQTGWVIEVAPETGALLIVQGHREVPEVVRAKKNPAIYDGGCMPVAQPAAPPPQANLGDEVAEPEPPPAPTPRSPFFGKK